MHGGQRPWVTPRPLRVIRVAPTGSKASPNVRYAFNGGLNLCVATNRREWDGPAVLPPRTAQRMTGGLEAREHIAMSHKTAAPVVHTIGIDTGKNTLHLIGVCAEN